MRVYLGEGRKCEEVCNSRCSVSAELGRGAVAVPRGWLKGGHTQCIILSLVLAQHSLQHHLCWAGSTTPRWRALSVRQYLVTLQIDYNFKEVVVVIISLSFLVSLFGLLLERCTVVPSDLICTVSDGRCLTGELHHGKRGKPWHCSFTVNSSEPELLSSVLTHWNTMSKTIFPRNFCYRSIFFPQYLDN